MKNLWSKTYVYRCIAVGCAFAALLSGCAQPVAVAPSAPADPAAASAAPLVPLAPPDFPQTYYSQLAASGKKVLHIDQALSLVTIEVHRGGRLASLGHDHVVASHDVTGYVAPDEKRADLYVPLDRLTVDETPLRAAAGFDTQPSKEAIEGTRNNMLGKVLEAERYPFALVRITRTDVRPDVLDVALTLHGVTRNWEVPATFEKTADGRLSVSGKMRFNQSDFGIKPFSVLGGALLVQDQLDLHFAIVADGA